MTPPSDNNRMHRRSGGFEEGADVAIALSSLEILFVNQMVISRDKGPLILYPRNQTLMMTSSSRLSTNTIFSARVGRRLST